MRCVALLTLIALVSSLTAAEPTREQAEHFTKHVKPVLEKHCYSCHSHAANKSKGGLMLDSRAALLTGGDSGPAIVPGKPAESLLLSAITHADDAPAMPPKGKLSDAEIAVLREWVTQGAPWPGSGSKTVSRPRGKISDEDRKWWAIQPLQTTEVPARPEANPVDRFIRDRLHKEGLAPSPAASRETLIRRVYFNLIGLPPSPAEVEEFVNDRDPKAYDKLVDRLLASPHYGERWARHWLDLVRYAESDGFRLDDYRPHAWRYRDYVIRSLNADKPYSRFVSEQLAGDELFPDNPEALAATGFLRLGIYEYNNRDVRGQWDNMQFDITDTVGDVFLGLGMGCARCHDHKFDPILQKDYYRLRAFFDGIMPRDDVPLATAAERERYAKQLAEWERKTADIRAKIEQIEAPVRAKAAKDAIAKFPEDIQAILHTPVAQRSPLDAQLGALAYRQVDYEFGRLDRKLKDDAKVKLVALRKDLAAFDHLQPAPLPAAMTVSELPQAAPTLIPKKGSASIEPGILTILDEKPLPIPPMSQSTGRRPALAAWLTRPDNPLTHRVIVNRVWQYHFGKGLVPNASDFGKLGGSPSHPELLDWLTSQFIAQGGSLKSLHRLILLSETYQQSATSPAPEMALRKDPENRWFWRQATRRLDAEQVRDTILAVTGQLDLTMAGPAVDSSKPRRTIYTRQTRNTRDPLLDVFDAPEGFQSAADRNTTTTPTQALLLFNSSMMRAHAKTFAARLAKDSADESARLDLAFRLAFGRPVRESERSAIMEFLRKQSNRNAPSAAVNAVNDVQFAKLPYREGRAAVVTPTEAIRLMLTDPKHLPNQNFTAEAFVQLRSTFDDGSVRPILTCRASGKDGHGWVFGVTSKKSAYKPQTLVLQLWGQEGYEPIFSGLHLDLNKPYFVAVSVDLANTAKGGVTFFVKDLSNDDEPMLSAQHAHKVTKFTQSPGKLRFGSSDGVNEKFWDGLIDDVRLSRAALPAEKLLLTTEGVTETTVGYWQFEARPGPMRDSSPNGLHLSAIGASPKTSSRPSSPAETGWADLCHVLLNANEFLYID